MTDVVTDDSASEVLTLAAASEYDAESLWDARSTLESVESDESTHTVIAEGSAAAQMSKAIETATEREPTADDTASIASGHSARRSHGNLSRAPILDAGPAPPPTYQAATAWRASPAPLNGHVQRAPTNKLVASSKDLKWPPTSIGTWSLKRRTQHTRMSDWSSSSLSIPRNRLLS